MIFRLAVALCAVLAPLISLAAGPSPTFDALSTGSLTVTGSSTIPFVQTGPGASTTRTLDQRAKERLNLLDFRTSPDQGNGVVDDGPMFRAAITECARTGSRRLYIPNPPVEWRIGSVDAHGCGMTFGNDAGDQNSCTLEGESRNTGGRWTGGVNIKLGAGVNRPLVCVMPGANSPVLKHLRLDGAREAQTGWTGGPEGKLYVIQVEDGTVAGTPESSINLFDVQVTGGYNGNMYIGAGRGSTRIFNSYFEYSGQTTSDISLYLNGMDGDFVDFGIGSTKGTGVLFNEGSQYHWVGGATWMNETGVAINGAKVEHLTMDGVNIQYSYCNGLTEGSAGPFSGKQAGGHVLTNVTFEGNSKRTDNTCSDIVVDNNTLLSLVNPVFNGAVVTTDPMVKYNIDSIGTSLVRVANPMFAATSSKTAKWHYPNAVACANCVGVMNTWTPTIYGETTAGSPTYTVQTGRWVRNSADVTLRFAVQFSSLGGADGNLRIGGLPLWSRANSSTDIGYCTVSLVGGWTAPSGFTTLTAFIEENDNTIKIYRNGSGNSSTPVTAAEFASTGYMQGMCSYPAQ